MVRVDDSGAVTKCWLDRDELAQLEEAAARADWQREIAVQLMGRCGFRADEVTYPGDAELHWSEKGDCWFIEIRGKNTRGGEPKLRDAWMPERVEANIRRFSRERDRETDSSPTEATQSTPATEQSHGGAGSGSGNDLDDETLLQKARNASNGQKFTALWNGNTAGYESQSEADMALCCLLAFWTGGDATQMDRLFRESGLLRPKWDEVHYADGATYGERTIERAIGATSETYSPSSPDSSDPATTSGADSEDRASTEPTAGRVAYLHEKTDLLADRITELEAMVAEREATISMLEDERDNLRSALVDCRKMAEVDVDSDEGSASDEDGKQSVWRRVTEVLSD